MCVYTLTLHSPVPLSWTGTSHWDVWFGMYTVACISRRDVRDPVRKSTLSPDTSNGCELCVQACLAWVLVWTCAQHFLALTHLPVAVSLLAPTPGSGFAEDNLLWCTGD